jgi:hypothetical protein
MINIVCVKYGTKYDHTWVNRLYKMVEENCSLPFIFYCMTDNTDYLDAYIETIDIDHSLELDSFWWKLTIFNNIYAFDAPTIFLDLDVVIQNNIDYYMTKLFNEDKLTIPYTGVLKNYLMDGIWYEDAYHHAAGVNSSIMIFKPSKMKIILDNFMVDMDYNILKYRGVCRYLWGEHRDLFNLMEHGKDWYSYMKKYKVYIDDYNNYEKYRTKDGMLWMPHVPVVLLNGLENDNQRKRVLNRFGYFV